MHLPAYQHLFKANKLTSRAQKLQAMQTSCTLCPHHCKVDRTKGEKGKCQALDHAVVSEYGPHLGEEQPLVGKRGSGTIFFSHCNLQCVFCQNYPIAHCGEGYEVHDEQLATMMLNLQRHGCKNINLVTPTHFVANIVNAIVIAAKQGLSIPICYNTSSYESLEVIDSLDGVVDLYLADMKFFTPSASKYFLSNAKDYELHAKSTIKAMYNQVGNLLIDNEGNAIKGLMIRHLVMPNHTVDSKQILDWIASNLSLETFINIMNQYHPPRSLHDYPDINRTIKYNEYDEIMHYAKTLGFRDEP